MEINKEIQLYILKLLSEQFMYKDEIVEDCLKQFKNNLVAVSSLQFFRF